MSKNRVTGTYSQKINTNYERLINSSIFAMSKNKVIRNYLAKKQQIL